MRAGTPRKIRSDGIRLKGVVSKGSVVLKGIGLVCAALMACGPTRYLREVAAGAQTAVTEARSAGAEELAPYEYWSAVEYLDMAKYTAAYADFEQSLKYGSKATRMARRAKQAAHEIKRIRNAEGSSRDHRVRAQIPTRITP